MCSKKEIILAYSLIKIAMQKLEEGRGFGDCHTIKNLKYGAPVSMYSKNLQKSHGCCWCISQAS